MLPAPWTPRPRPPRLGNRCAIPTAPTAHRRAVREERKHHARACARARRQTILAVPTAWPLFKRSSVAAFERSVTASVSALRAEHRQLPGVGALVVTDQIRVAVCAFQLEVAVVRCQPRIEHFRNRDAPITEDERAWRLLAAMAGIALDANPQETLFRQVRSPTAGSSTFGDARGGPASDPCAESAASRAPRRHAPGTGRNVLLCWPETEALDAGGKRVRNCATRMPHSRRDGSSASTA